ncbi:winged helix-turn-helix domain-containing protein [Sphingomonas sp. SM33]|uniref:Winged helix-turn-helix domain-containing protein n=1 Tax=Sphingomonas telluris TaxID=2907998 RepID=A0ABS9VRZ5_9SPHN|nr:winged helix-turn-helix domain-containing protein [Sphingomonas telluris]
MNASATFPVRLAALTIDPVRRRITGPGGEASLEPLVLQLLLHLIDRKGQVLQRRELFNHLWGNAQVGDDSLNRLVGSLRKALERTSNGAVEIETVPRVGYRLLADSVDSDLKPSLNRRSVLVGGTCSVLALGGIAFWRATMNKRLAEAQQYTDRGDELLRDAVPIEAGNAVPPLRSALEIDPGNAKALGLLALAEETRANNGGSSDAGETLGEAERAARAALKLDPDEPHARLAMIDIRAANLVWTQMEDRLEALRRSFPTNVHVLGSLTSFLQAAGRTSKSWTVNEQAAALAPTSPTPQWRRALRLWTAGRNEEALSLSERLLPLWPRHSLVWNARFMILAFTGRTGAAEAMLREAVGPAENAHPVRLAQWLPTLDAFADPSRERVARAREANVAAARLNPGQATYAAMALAQLGEIDASFAVINALLLSKGPLVAERPIVPRSFVANSPSWCRTQWLFMPPLARVRNDDRFAALCEEIGLSAYWRQRGVVPDTRLPEW